MLLCSILLLRGSRLFDESAFRARLLRSGSRVCGTVMAIAGLFFLAYGAWVVGGPDSAITSPIMPGVTYERLRIGDAVGHLVVIDLDEGCANLATSEVSKDGTASASKTITWAIGNDLSVAINGGFFYPYDQSTAWDVYPSEGEEVTVLGPVVRPPGGLLQLGGDHGKDGKDSNDSEHEAVRSQAAAQWSGRSFWVDGDGRAHIGELPGGAALAVTGRDQILEDGVIVAPPSEPYPRTVVSVDATGRRLWWLVVDGKQPGYSSGLPLADVAALLAERGAMDALELDGGGSSTLVLNDGSGPRVASRPMQVRVPGRSRVVANHLGIAAADDEACNSDPLVPSDG